ncbi:ATP-binding protein [Microbacterium sp.]|uniref:ATP-binding protein n=1 Tax=Microbacterium sp. TaxID=51671 RepID=UPI003A945E5A
MESGASRSPSGVHRRSGRFQLVLAMNPVRAATTGARRQCACPPMSIRRYASSCRGRGRIDIDLQVHAGRGGRHRRALAGDPRGRAGCGGPLARSAWRTPWPEREVPVSGSAGSCVCRRRRAPLDRGLERGGRARTTVFAPGVDERSAGRTRPASIRTGPPCS